MKLTQLARIMVTKPSAFLTIKKAAHYASVLTDMRENRVVSNKQSTNCVISPRASSLGGGGREVERGESLQRCLRHFNATPNTPRGSLLS